jgi:hypothetical protein
MTMRSRRLVEKINRYTQRNHGSVTEPGPTRESTETES